MTIHIMLDLETWGTEPGSDIRSIGACVFVPHTGAVSTPDHIQTQPGHPSLTFYVACDNPVAFVSCNQCYTVYSDSGPCPCCMSEDTRIERSWELTRDPQTVQWWNEQTDEARAAFADPVDLREALVRFGHWYCDIARTAYPENADNQNPLDTGVRLWSHGPAFDPPILAAAYKAVGLPVPWHYRAPRDTRTAFDMAGIDDHTAWLNQHPGPLGIPHHALDDAICQARAVCEAYGRVQEWRDDAQSYDDNLSAAEDRRFD